MLLASSLTDNSKFKFKVTYVLVEIIQFFAEFMEFRSMFLLLNINNNILFTMNVRNFTFKRCAQYGIMGKWSLNGAIII